MSPVAPCTPTKPVWRQRAEEACFRCPYPCSFALVQSSKGEDRLAIDGRHHCDGAAASLWAVFDGHRCADVAGHASKLVPHLVFSSPFWPAFPGDALRSALCECHESARREELRGGSTAVVVVATGPTIWACGAGDSRAVAGLRGGGVRRLTVDHTTAVPEELARIKAAGGHVEWGRLGGLLPMTRGLGNFRLEADGFACLPTVASISRREAEFVVIATDGLWDVVSDEQCCAHVREWEKGGGHGGSIADRLAGLARRLGSTDDIAVVVAFFPQVTPCLTPPHPGATFAAFGGA